MPEGAPLAEAAVQISMDESLLSAEVQNLQERLGPLVEAGAAPMQAISQGTATAAQGSRILVQGLNSLTTSIESGNINARGFLGTLRMLGNEGGQVGAILGKIGMIGIAAFAGWKAGGAIARRLGLVDEMSAEELAAIRAADGIERWKDSIEDAISAIREPGALHDVGFLDAMFGINQQGMSDQMALAVAQAEAAGRDAAQVKADFARQAAENVKAHAEEENRAIAAALDETVNNYTSAREQIENEIAQIKQISYVGMDPAEAKKAYADDLATVRDLEKQKRDLEKAGLAEIGALRAQQAQNNAEMSRAEIQSRIADLEAKKNAEQGATLAAGGMAIWEKAMAARTAIGVGEPLGPVAFGNQGGAQVAATLAAERAIMESNTGDPTTEEVKASNKHLENMEAIQREMVVALRERGGSVWLGGS